MPKQKHGFDGQSDDSEEEEDQNDNDEDQKFFQPKIEEAEEKTLENAKKIDITLSGKRFEAEKSTNMLL